MALRRRARQFFLCGRPRHGVAARGPRLLAQGRRRRLGWRRRRGSGARRDHSLGAGNRHGQSARAKLFHLPRRLQRRPEPVAREPARRARPRALPVVLSHARVPEDARPGGRWRDRHRQRDGRAGLREHWRVDPRPQHVRPGTGSVARRDLEGLVGRGAALSRADFRPHAPQARTAQDERRHDVLLRHRRDARRARAGEAGRGRQGHPHRRRRGDRAAISSGAAYRRTASRRSAGVDGLRRKPLERARYACPRLRMLEARGRRASLAYPLAQARGVKTFLLMLASAFCGALFFGVGLYVWFYWQISHLERPGAAVRFPPRSESTVQVAPPIVERERFYGSTGLYTGAFSPSFDKKVLAAGPGTIVGSVTSSGKPLKGLRLRLALNGSVMSQWAISNADGRYEIAVPYGKYRVDGYELDSSVAQDVLAGKTDSPRQGHGGVDVTAVDA